MAIKSNFNKEIQLCNAPFEDDKQSHRLVATFIALTAIGGGIAILTGVDEFPTAWLEGTPFSDYTVPALMLAIVVGGSSLLSVITLFTGRKSGVIISIVAGLIMMVYIITEVMILKQDPPGPTWVEEIYFGLGLMLFALALYLRAVKNISDEK